jgi:D-alanine-D-alanine ligase
VKLEELRGRLRLRRDELLRLRVAVLAGGGSSEREVSLSSGQAVASALVSAGFPVELLELQQDNLTVIRRVLGGNDPEKPPERYPAVASTELSQRVSATTPIMECLPKVQMIFTTLHGRHGEDGVWQGLFELLGVPYVSAGVKGSALAMDKLISKRLFQQLGIPTPRYWVERPGASCRDEVDKAVPQLVAKPVAQGSSVGIDFVENNKRGWMRIAELASQHGTMIIEERIQGRELTAGVIGDEHGVLALPLVDIKPQHGAFYSYSAKYTAGGSEYSCPADIAAAHADTIQGHALTIFREFELAPYARMDCMLDTDGVPWFLEANTLPGFTSLSLLPMAANAAGIEFAELIEMLMFMALERWERGGGKRP